MAFVFYDCETSGLNTRFDQILHFAAVRTDECLNEIDAFEMRCRLDRHVLPHPQALVITRRSLADVYDPRLPSHYELMCEVAALIERWSPAVFVGYNSIGFDEEILRHSLYRTLHDPYLTIRNGNARGDALGLSRSAAFFRPGLLVIPAGPDGRETFTLAALSEANGHDASDAHSALADVRATVALARKIATGDEGLWSRFLRFTNGQAVASVLDDGFPIGVVAFRGNTPRCVVAVSIGHGQDRNARYCVDLSRLDEIRSKSETELGELLSDREGPVIRVKVKGSPSLCELWDLPRDALRGLSEEDYEARAVLVREDPRLGERLLAMLRAGEGDWPTSEHVEEQLYGGGFLCRADEGLRDAFHSQAWEERPSLLARLEDPRMRRLGERLVFLERADVMDPQRRGLLEAAARDRLHRPADEVPWCTFGSAEQVLRDTMPDNSSLAAEYADLRAAMA